MKKKNSIVPANAQVPLAIVLAVFFAIILYWRFGPQIRGESSPLPPVAVAPDNGPEGSLEDLKTILAKVEKEPFEYEERPKTIPPLARNPFRQEGPPVSELTDEEALGPQPLQPVEDADEVSEEVLIEQMREERLAALVLSGTCVVANQAMAIINGRYLREGDEVEGFVVKDVREREVVLEDDAGPATIAISPVMWFSDQQGMYDITIEKKEPER